MERVVEQRVTNLSQGLLILITMSPPLLHVLGLVPQSVLAGLFFVMGVWPETTGADGSYKDFRGMELPSRSCGYLVTNLRSGTMTR